MTFRAKPVVKRSHRPSWEMKERRNLYLNIGFGLVVLVAVLILAIAAGVSWYDEHLSPLASVNGQSITKDDYRQRYDIEAYRIGAAERRITDEFNAGRLTEDQRDTQAAIISQGRQQLPQLALERLIDSRVQAVLAGQEGVTVTAEQVDAQLVKEETLPEQRHAWLIEVRPKVDADKDEPTAQQKADAKKVADEALAELTAGKKFEDVAKAKSTASTAPIGGDLGWVSRDGNEDETFLEALFALPDGGRTDVVEGQDGTFRIGRVTEIVAATDDPQYRQGIVERGWLEAYREVVRTDLIRSGLRDKIKAQALQSGPQRRVAEIYIAGYTDETGAPAEPPADGVKVRHILYSPKDDPQGAGDLAEDDPAWKTAEDEAKAAYAKIKADPKQFDAIARADSDEGQAATTGGKLPYYGPLDAIDPKFAFAIFKKDLKPGQLLEPVRSDFGWHVIQVMYFPPDSAEADKLKAQADGGADFAQLARDFSDGSEAEKGGELGWVARFQRAKAEEDAIFAAPVGNVGQPVIVEGDGIHIYKVLQEATRTPTADQKAELEQTAFNNWYDAKKADFKIDRVDAAA